MGYQDSDHASHYENLLKVVVKRRSVRRFETSGNGKTPTKSWADGKISTSTRNRLTCAWPQPPFRRKSVGLGGTNGSRKCARVAQHADGFRKCSTHPMRCSALAALLFLEFRDRLDPALFLDGIADLIAGMPIV
jgi:hypothetical protein